MKAMVAWRIPQRIATPFLLSVVIAVASSCGPRPAPTLLSAHLFADGFASPVELVSPPDGSGRLFIVDQVGLIWVLANGRRLQQPFLDIRDRLVELMPFYDERGLLALAFHPQFTSNGLFYVYYSAALRAGLSSAEWDHTTRVSEFRVSASDVNRADVSSERVILSIDKPGYNFEGGGLAFGPDGYLYIGTGDSVHDPSAHAGQYAQDLSSLLGKILRIDVNPGSPEVNSGNYHIPQGNPFIHIGGRPEIYASGFRNPYRIWFDEGAATPTRLFAADVGQAMMEEFDLVVAGSNYGWPIREGTTCFNAHNWQQPRPRCASAGMTDPLFAYPHAGKASAIVGGVVYRGANLPALDGAVVFGDWGRGPQTLFAARPPVEGDGRWSVQQIRVQVPGPAGAQLLGVAEAEPSVLYLLTKDPGVGPEGNSGKIYSLASP